MAVSSLMVIVCLVPGLAILLGIPRMRESASHFRIPWRAYWLIGAAEVAAAAGVLAGLWWHPIGIAAAAGMIALLAGALVAHRRAGDSGREMTTALVALVLTVAYLVIAFA